MKPYESYIEQPIRSLQTMLRLIAREDDRYSPLIPDGIYGPETAAAVTVFQRLHGIPVSGIADQDTWEAVVEESAGTAVRLSEAWPVHILLEPGQVIRKGERSPNLYLVQAMLTALADSYQSIPAPGVTGLLDEATADSLGEFQRLSGLPMTGHLDKHTWKHLALHYPLAAGRISTDAR